MPETCPFSPVAGRKEYKGREIRDLPDILDHDEQRPLSILSTLLVIPMNYVEIVAS